MKKISYLSIVAAALALASCSQDDLMDNGISGDSGNAIAFESYLGKSAQSRATVVTTESLYKEGFTVDAYYTRTDDFSPEATGEEFMKTTKVTYNEDKAAWTYSPLKYWPNNTDEKISFFAYGPYGNTNIKLNETTVSSINFTVQNDVLNQVDFIYNNQKDNSTLDKTKLTVSDKVKFQFQHALSRIGFTVAAAVDETSVGKVKLDGNSRINVKKVALVSGDVNAYTDDAAGPFYKSGTLDMLTGKWGSYSSETQAFTFAGKERFYRSVQDDDVATPDKIDVVQLHKFNQSQRLLNDDSYLMIIPTDNTTDATAKTSFKIYIEYDVITEDDDNADVSKITNKILSENALDVAFEAGKAYNFNLILGMTSVKFDVDKVVDWDNADNTNEWLPENEEVPVWDEETETFLIYNAAQLATMRDRINKGETYSDSKARASVNYAEASYKQMADIDLSGYDNWMPIGNSASNPFKGKYDGLKHTIKGLNLNNQNEDVYTAGLFGYVEDAKIDNINITDCSMTGKYIGAIAGTLKGATVKDCTTSGTGDEISFCGGIVSQNRDGSKIIHCTNNINFTEAESVGGITYYNDCNISVCVNNGNISGTTGNGGITFMSGNGNLISHIVACYNTGAISGSHYTVGGLVGYAKSTVIKASYNTGTASEGAIIGFGEENNTIELDACYYSENSCQKAIGYGTLDETNSAALHAIEGTDWSEAMNAMNQVLARLHKNASESDKELYNWQYVNGSGNAPLTLKTGCVEIVKKTALKGKGTEQDPYQISDAKDLKLMVNFIKNNTLPANGCKEYNSTETYYLQVGDIDFKEEEWNLSIIQIVTFNGNFDGGNYEMKNYTLQYGLIGNNNGTLKNIHFTDANVVDAKAPVLAGTNKGNIICCSYAGTWSTSASYRAVFAEDNYGSVIGCSFNGRYTLSAVYSAPIVGWNAHHVIGCYSSGEINGQDSVSRIAGVVRNTDSVEEDKKCIGCYTTAEFSSKYKCFPIFFGIENGISKSNYYKATIMDDNTLDDDGSIKISNNEEWKTAAEEMNKAIKEASYNYEYVVNSNESTKEAFPYVLVELTTNE